MSAIVAAVLAALKIAWAWGLPFLGPLLARAAPWIGWVPGLAGIGKSLRVASYVAVLGLGAWGAVKLTHWWEGDKLTPREARSQCDVAVTAAAVKARMAALDAKERALADRARAVEAAEGELSKIKGEMDDERARVAATQLIGADDPWLQSWHKRGR